MTTTGAPAPLAGLVGLRPPVKRHKIPARQKWTLQAGRCKAHAASIEADVYNGASTEAIHRQQTRNVGSHRFCSEQNRWLPLANETFFRLQAGEKSCMIKGNDKEARYS